MRPPACRLSTRSSRDTTTADLGLRRLGEPLVRPLPSVCLFPVTAHQRITTAEADHCLALKGHRECQGRTPSAESTLVGRNWPRSEFREIRFEICYAVHFSVARNFVEISYAVHFP